MALFILCGSNSSFSTRFYILALIALVLVSCCSYCSSTSIVSPVVDIDRSSGDIDEIIGNDDLIPIQLPSYQYIDAPEPNNRFLHLLLKSAINQLDHRHHPQYNKRYASQAFHAMRG